MYIEILTFWAFALQISPLMERSPRVKKFEYFKNKLDYGAQIS